VILEEIDGFFRSDPGLLGEGFESEAADAVAVLNFLEGVGDVGIGTALRDDALVAAEVAGDLALEAVSLGHLLAAAVAGIVVKGGGGISGSVEFGAIDFKDAGGTGEFEFFDVLVGGPCDLVIERFEKMLPCED
jgi:hypothetical protein